MLAIKITDVKAFMHHLLIGNTFDCFETVEVSITTFNTFSIDGKLKRDFFDTDTLDIFGQRHMNYSLWKELKPYSYSIIRGKQPPLHFKIIFQLPADRIQAVLKEIHTQAISEIVRGLYLNLQYKNNELLCTTGVSLGAFVPDKRVEHEWDTFVKTFLKDQHITFDAM